MLRYRASASTKLRESVSLGGMSVPVPTTAAELVAYQTGSVVSRTLVKKPVGTVTAFAFDKDQALSEHTAPYDALVHVIDGEARITIGEAAYDVNAGQMLMLPAKVPHAVHATVKFKMILTMIRA